MRNIKFILLFLLATIGLNAWAATATDIMYVVSGKCNVPLTKGMNSAKYQLFTWDGTTASVTTDVTCDIGGENPGTAGNYYNSLSLSYSDLKNTSNYSTSSSSNRTMQAIKLGGGNKLTISLGSKAMTKVLVVGYVNSTDKLTLDVLGETISTNEKKYFVVEKEQQYKGSIEINNTTSKEYHFFIYMIEGPAGPSDDATLKEIKYGSTVIPGFDPNKTEYEVELSAGTTTVPTVSATATDAKAKNTEITQASTLPGIATIVVTAEDGSKKTYKITFTVESGAPKVESATWPEMRGKSGVIDQVNMTIVGQVLNGKSLTLEPTFTGKYVTSWSPTGPQNFATATNNTIEYTFTNTQTSETSKYKVTITEAPPVSSDATLKSLNVAGYTISFAPDKYNYEVPLKDGTTTVPAVTYETKDAMATVVKTDAESVMGTTKIVVTAEDGTTELTYTIKFSIKSDLTLHVPDIYENQYKGKLQEFNGRYYEVYYINRDVDSKLSIAVSNVDKSGSISTNSDDKNTTAKDGWVRIKSSGSGGDTNGKATDEFQQSIRKVNIIDGNEIIMHISGFDEFSFYGKDNSSSAPKCFDVYINGNKQAYTPNNTYTIRRFALDGGENIIRLTATTTSNSVFVGFSLRESNTPRVRYVEGNDSAQHILATENLKKITYYLKNSKAEGAKTELKWEGNAATGIGMNINSTGDTAIVSGTALCGPGEYKYYIITTQNGSETSRESGIFTVSTDIKTETDTVIDAYVGENMDQIIFRYYAASGEDVTIKWANDKMPEGLEIKDNKGKHNLILGGLINATPGTYRYTVTVAGNADAVITGEIEVISQDLGVDPILFLYRRKSLRIKNSDEIKEPAFQALKENKKFNLKARRAYEGTRNADFYKPFKAVIISEDVSADSPEVIDVLLGNTYSLPVLNMKGFTYARPELNWGIPDNGTRDTLTHNSGTIFIQRSEHPIFSKFTNKSNGDKIQILDAAKLEKHGSDNAGTNGVMPINIQLDGTYCLATAYTRSMDPKIDNPREAYFTDGELQTIIHEIPASMRGGKKYICLPLALGDLSYDYLTQDGKKLLEGIMTYLLSSESATIEPASLQITKFSIGDINADIDQTNNLIELKLKASEFAEMDSLRKAKPVITLADPEYTYVTPGSKEEVNLEYCMYTSQKYVVSDYIRRRVYEFTLHLTYPQGIEDVYVAGEWVNIYDMYGRKVATTNENIYTMDLPRGIYIAVTATGQTIKIMR